MRSRQKIRKKHKGMVIPRPPAKPIEVSCTLCEFYRFSWMKLAVSLLMLGTVTLGILTPILSRTTVIPCKFLDGTGKASCPINPAAPAVSTQYFSNSMLDQLYSIAYLVVFFMFIPYTLGCAIVYLYKRFFGSQL